MQDDGLAAVRADGDDAQGHFRQFADAFHVLAGRFRQFFIGLAVRNVAFPAGHFFVYRFDLFQYVKAGRVFFEQLALVFVARADLDRVEVVEDIQTGDSQVVEAVQHSRVFDDSRIEPAAAAGTARNGAEFMARVAEVFADFVVLFRREGACADAGRVGFDDADDVFHAAGADAGAGAGAAGRRVGAGDEGIRAVVEVEHGRLGAFKEDLLAFLDVQVGRVVRILDVLADLVGVAQIFLEHRIVIEAFAAVVFLK